jgi:hypothetical protein
VARTALVTLAVLRVATVGLGIASIVTGFRAGELYWLYGVGVALIGVGFWPNPRLVAGLWAVAAGIALGGASTTRHSQPTGLIVAVTLACAGIVAVRKGPELVARLRARR